MTHKLTLAPLRGFTTFTFRNVYWKLFGGIDDAVAPFISTTAGLHIRRNHIRDVLPENNDGPPVTPQLIGKSPSEFIRLARYLFDVGYETVNWNLGCPFPMIAKKGRGSGMLPHPERIDAFLDEVIPAIPGKLSIKTRLGRFSAEEMAHLMPVFNRYPLTELIVHPRIGIQRYDGTPDLETFAWVLNESVHPVVYNGDIVRLSDFQRLSARFPGVSRWMIGRGVMINPMLPGEIKHVVGAGRKADGDPIAAFREFHHALFDGFSAILSGPVHLVGRMIGFWEYFEQSFENGRKIAKKIRKVRKPEAYLALVDGFLDHGAVWRED